MNRIELNELIDQGPVKIHMHDGTVFEVPSKEHALVGDELAVVLVHCDDDKLRNMPFSLKNIGSVESLSQASEP